MTAKKFTYQHGSKKITLPKFSHLPFGVVRKMRKEKTDEQFFLLLEETLKNDPKTLDVIDSMTAEEVIALITAWQKDAGVSVGESLEQ